MTLKLTENPSQEELTAIRCIIFDTIQDGNKFTKKTQSLYEIMCLFDKPIYKEIVDSMLEMAK